MILKRLLLAALVTTTMPGCAAKPNATSICRQIEAAGIGTSCVQVKPEVINARAKTKVDFDLVRVRGKKGAVLDFASDEDYSATVNAYAAVAMLAGPHRYGNPSTRIFVQLNGDAALEDGSAVKAIVGGEAAPPVSSAAQSASTPAAPSGGALTEPRADMPKPLVMEATELYAEYQRNEVAADEKFKGKVLRVVGQLSSIDKDAFGNMVLKVAAGDSPFAIVSAKMRDSEKARVVRLQKKEVLAVECEGGIMIARTPTLQDCTVLLEGSKKK